MKLTDRIASLEHELRALRERQDVTLGRPGGHGATAKDYRLLSCREVGRIYRLDRHTVANDWRAGKIPGRRRGRAILVSAKRAEELYGVDGVML